MQQILQDNTKDSKEKYCQDIDSCRFAETEVIRKKFCENNSEYCPENFSVCARELIRRI